MTAAIVDGASNKGIAMALALSEPTVKDHVSNIFDKLGVSTWMELALQAAHHRMIAAGPTEPASPPGASAQPNKPAAGKLT